MNGNGILTPARNNGNGFVHLESDHDEPTLKDLVVEYVNNDTEITVLTDELRRLQATNTRILKDIANKHLISAPTVKVIKYKKKFYSVSRQSIHSLVAIQVAETA